MWSWHRKSFGFERQLSDSTPLFSFPRQSTTRHSGCSHLPITDQVRPKHRSATVLRWEPSPSIIHHFRILLWCIFNNWPYLHLAWSQGDHEFGHVCPSACASVHQQQQNKSFSQSRGSKRLILSWLEHLQINALPDAIWSSGIKKWI